VAGVDCSARVQVVDDMASLGHVFHTPVSPVNSTTTFMGRSWTRLDMTQTKAWLVWPRALVPLIIIGQCMCI